MPNRTNDDLYLPNLVENEIGIRAARKGRYARVAGLGQLTSREYLGVQLI